MTDVVEPVDTAEPGGEPPAARQPMLHFKLAVIDNSLWTLSRSLLVIALFFLAQLSEGGIQRLVQINALNEMEVKFKEDLRAKQEEFASLEVATLNVVKAVLALENAAKYSPQRDARPQNYDDLVDRLKTQVEALDQRFQARKQRLSDSLEETIPPLIAVSRRTVRSFQELALAAPGGAPVLERKLRAQIEQLKSYDDDFDVYAEEYKRELVDRILARKDELAHVGDERGTIEAPGASQVR